MPQDRAKTPIPPPAMARWVLENVREPFENSRGGRGKTLSSFVRLLVLLASQDSASFCLSVLLRAALFGCSNSSSCKGRGKILATSLTPKRIWHRSPTRSISLSRDAIRLSLTVPLAFDPLDGGKALWPDDDPRVESSASPFRVEFQGNGNFGQNRSLLCTVEVSGMTASRREAAAKGSTCPAKPSRSHLLAHFKFKVVSDDASCRTRRRGSPCEASAGSGD